MANNNSKDNDNDKVKKGETKEAVSQVMEQIQSKHGEGAIMKLGEVSHADVDAIPTGSLALDIGLGVGGIPKGRIVEIFGPESSGKTTLALHVLANAQKMGGNAAFVDAEHALDPVYANKIGVDLDNLLISQPDSGEDALDIVETLVKSDVISVIVVDSVAALTPKAEIEGSMEDQQIGLQARLMSKALRKLASIAGEHGTTVIFLNQIRMKVGVRFGNPETTSGGKALKFYSSVRIRLGRRAKIERDGSIVGNRVHAKIVKNKVAPPFKEVDFDIIYGRGISRLSDIIRTGEDYDVINRKGSYYYYDEEKMGQGLSNAREWLGENEDAQEEIVKEIKKKALQEKEEDEEEG